MHPCGLADLEEPFWSGSRWFRRGDATVGLVVLGEERTVYAITAHDEPGTLVLLLELLDEVPDNTMITGPIGLAAAVGAVTEIEDWGVHVKCVLSDLTRLPEPVGVVPLPAADSSRFRTAADQDPDAVFFLESMLADDTFVEIPDPGDPDSLIAAAGTHVLGEHHGVAAVGAVYVRPDHRGHGLGALVTSGVCARLAGRVETIGLNVHAANTPARRTCTKIAFTDILEYEESVLRPKM